MKQYTRYQIIERLTAVVSSGSSIVTAGSGIGLSARLSEQGGADLVVIYNSGRFRMQGLTSWAGYLPIGDANGIMLEMGEREVLPVVDAVPVIAGVFASDPTRVLSHLLGQVKALGFSGVTNFPTVAYLEGDFRTAMEQTGLGFDREIEMVELARGLDLFTSVYVFTPEQAARMVDAGADCVIAHMGNTAGGGVGQREGVKPLDLAIDSTRAIAEAAWAIDPSVFVLCHGGPIATPADAALVIGQAGVDGFVAASSIERLPVEVALRTTTAEFKSIPGGRRREGTDHE